MVFPYRARSLSRTALFSSYRSEEFWRQHGRLWISRVSRLLSIPVPRRLPPIPARTQILILAMPVPTFPFSEVSCVHGPRPIRYRIPAHLSLHPLLDYRSSRFSPRAGEQYKGRLATLGPTRPVYDTAISFFFFFTLGRNISRFSYSSGLDILTLDLKTTKALRYSRQVTLPVFSCAFPGGGYWLSSAYACLLRAPFILRRTTSIAADTGRGSIEVPVVTAAERRV